MADDSSLEKLVKGSTLLAVALAACGYLVISLHEGGYGYVSPNPLRPKVISAGALFLLFSGSPALLGWSSGKEISEEVNKTSWADWAAAGAVVFVVRTLLVVVLRMLFFRTSEPSAVRATGWVLAELTLILLLYLINKVKRPESNILIILFFVVTMPAFIYEVVRAFKSAEDLQLTAWTLCVSIAGLLYRTHLKDISGLGKPILGFALPFIFAVAFSKLLYPFIDYSWGGGRPARVEILLSKESFAPNLRVHRYLLDETDAGFYLADRINGTTQFVPRSQISLLTYLSK